MLLTKEGKCSGSIEKKLSMINSNQRFANSKIEMVAFSLVQ